MRIEHRHLSKVGSGGSYGGKEYLWGNVPALDVLRFGASEGEAYGGELSLLFAGACLIRFDSDTRLHY